MITPQNLVKHELIGLEARVVECTNKASIGIRGMVVDETRNMLVIESGGKEKRLAKGQCVFSFRLGEKWVRVDGRLLVARPEDRIKKRHAKW